MQKALFQAIDKAKVDADVDARLADINRERASASVEFLIAMSHCLKKIRILLPVGQTMATVLKVF